MAAGRFGNLCHADSNPLLVCHKSSLVYGNGSHEDLGMPLDHQTPHNRGCGEALSEDKRAS